MVVFCALASMRHIDVLSPSFPSCLNYSFTNSLATDPSVLISRGTRTTGETRPSLCSCHSVCSWEHVAYMSQGWAHCPISEINPYSNDKCGKQESVTTSLVHYTHTDTQEEWMKRCSQSARHSFPLSCEIVCAEMGYLWIRGELVFVCVCACQELEQ